MPKDFSNPSTLKFMTESFEKETEKRIAWFLRNQDKIQKAAEAKEQKDTYKTNSLIRRAYIENSLTMLINHLQATAGNRRKKALRDGPILGIAAIKHDDEGPSSVSEPVMKPVDENVRRILQTNLPIGGRREYLKERNRTKPEDRYNFCETTNNVYGWCLRDSKATASSRFGRMYTYHRGVRSRSGPQPDPPYYKHPPPASNLVCFSSM